MRPHSESLSFGSGSSNAINKRIWNHVPVANKKIEQREKGVKVSSKIIKESTAFSVIGGHVKISNSKRLSSVLECRK